MKVITRNWTALDQCGNASTGSQKIIVKDRTSPVLTVPSNVTLECPANTEPGATGTATATDTCGTATVSYKDLVTAGCGATKVIKRTWTAVDDCGNISTKI